MRKLPVAAILAACALGLSACGTDNPVKSDNTQPAQTPTTEGVSGKLAGAGASSQEAAMNAWLANFQQANPDAQITYDPVGSGAGITQFTSKQVAWAGSDAALEGDEITKAKDACGSDALHLPIYISPVAVVFNLEGVDSLQLTPETIADIFTGKISNWNDPAIAADNPGVTLPDLKITPVHRADKSGTTENFTDYLHTAAPENWTAKPSKTWPIEGGESGDKTAGMISTVQSGQGTIGYADASQAGTLGTVALKAGDSFVKFSAESAAKAADVAKPGEGASDTNLTLAIDRKPAEAGAYPLILVSYGIVCSKYNDAEQAKLVKALMGYIASDAGQKSAAEHAGSAPISAQMREKVQKAIDSIN